MRRPITVVFIEPFHDKVSKPKLLGLLRKFTTIEVIEQKEIEPNIEFIDSFRTIPDLFFDQINVQSDSTVVFVSSFPLEDNWFIRRGKKALKSARKSSNMQWIAVSTYETADIATYGSIFPEKLVAAIILQGLFTSRFLDAGGQYDNLYAAVPESSIFQFCALKEEILISFRSLTIGHRAYSVLKGVGLASGEIDQFQRDLNTLKDTSIDRVRRSATEHQLTWGFISNVVVATLFFILGILFQTQSDNHALTERPVASESQIKCR